MSQQDEQGDKNTEAMEAEIRRTRAELGETVEALKVKLNPQRIRDEAVQNVREATVGRVEDLTEDAKWKVKGVGNDMLDTIKRNPMPAALAAIGLGWLFMERRSNNRQRPSRDRYGYGSQGGTYSGYGRYEGQGGYYDASARRGEYRTGNERDLGVYDNEQGGMRERAGQALGNMQDKAENVAQRTGEKAGHVADSARQGVQQVAETVGEGVQQVTETAREGVQQVAQQAQHGAQQVKTWFGELMDDKPLVIGAAAMAVGAAIGFSLPATQKENEVFGEARDKVVELAQEKASDTAQMVQQVAQQAGTAAKDAAKEAVKTETEKQKVGGQ